MQGEAQQRLPQGAVVDEDDPAGGGQPAANCSSILDVSLVMNGAVLAARNPAETQTRALRYRRESSATAHLQAKSMCGWIPVREK